MIALAIAAGRHILCRARGAVQKCLPTAAARLASGNQCMERLVARQRRHHAPRDRAWDIQGVIQGLAFRRTRFRVSTLAGLEASWREGEERFTTPATPAAIRGSDDTATPAAGEVSPGDLVRAQKARHCGAWQLRASIGAALVILAILAGTGDANFTAASAVQDAPAVV